MKQAGTRKPDKTTRSGRSANSKGKPARPEPEFGLGSEEERRARRDQILEEHRETIKRLGE